MTLVALPQIVAFRPRREIGVIGGLAELPSGLSIVERGHVLSTPADMRWPGGCCLHNLVRPPTPA